jgi:hypothetical protein
VTNRHETERSEWHVNAGFEMRERMGQGEEAKSGRRICEFKDHWQLYGVFLVLSHQTHTTSSFKLKCNDQCLEFVLSTYLISTES